MKYLYTILLFLFFSTLYGQRITISKTEVIGDKINIYYELLGDNPGQLFNVSIFSSTDNFAYPLIFTSGDIGKDIKAGSGKKIQWDAGKELVNFKGNISFELKASLAYTPLLISSPYEGQILKRGNTYPVYWTGGEEVPPQLELYKGENKIMDIPNQANKNSSNMLLPINIKPGENYSIKLTNDNGTVSSHFIVKRKIPLVVKVAPLALIGAGAFVLFMNKGSKAAGISSEMPEEELPGPPVPQNK